MERKTITIGGAVLGFLLAVSPGSVPAQCEVARLSADDGATLDRFGEAVSAGPGYAVVGSPGAYGEASQSGAVFVFAQSADIWQFQHLLTAGDAVENAQLGMSVSISFPRIVAGAPQPFDSGPGAAYVFSQDIGQGRCVWVEEATLTASDGVVGDMFGMAVSIYGDHVAVSASGGGSGAVYVFRRSEDIWVEEVKVEPVGGDEDGFGGSIDMEGDYLLVGAHLDDDLGSDAGSVYVFRREGTTWTEEAKLTALDGAAGDNFGRSVAISGDRVVVGASGDADAGPASGSAYVFRRTGTDWVEEAKLTARDAAAGRGFGQAVDTDGGYILAGASGSVYVFRRDGGVWVQEAKLTASDDAPFHRFGEAVSLSEAYALVGASDNGEGHWTGSAYVDQILAGPDCNANTINDACEPNEDCNDNAVQDICDVADGTSEDCNGNRVPDECEPDCNNNGVPNSCDIADGTSEDCNDDGVPDECQAPVVPSVVSADPPNCAVDARQPSSLDGSIQYGWQSVEVRFDCDADFLTTAHFQVFELGGDGIAPDVIAVDFIDERAVVVGLSEPIEPGTWTCLNIADSIGRGPCLGSLPGDVNGDYESQASDILAIIDCLNGVADPPCQMWQCDADRDETCGPADILRVIDLLNGAGSFESWYARTLPQCPTAP
jgi:hypothetical protein